jgi:hypothetical protein
MTACACTSDEGSSTKQAVGDDFETTEIVHGDAAVWWLSGDSELTSKTSSFTAIVSRLGCNSGVTGNVLEPQLDYGDTQVVVTFEVELASGGAHFCQSNREVPYEVVLLEPVGDRELVDGACLAEGEARTTSHCAQGGVRWQR